MALSDLIQKIIQDAKDESQQILKNAEKEAERILKEADQKIAEMQEKNSKEISEKQKIMDNKTQALANTERKNLLLNKKRELLEKVFEAALSKLNKAPEKDIEHLIENAIKSIPAKKGKIYPAKSQTSIVKKALKASGKDYDIAEERNTQGGFVFEDDNSEVDFSFESLIQKEIRPKKELEVATELFQNK